MIVHLKLYADTEKACDADESPPLAVDLPLESTVADLLLYKRLKTDAPGLVLVNGVNKGPEHVLKEGDIVSVFPHRAGGKA